jgi:hypothetical protein
MLCFVNILDKDETMDNVQKHNMCNVIYVCLKGVTLCGGTTFPSFSVDLILLLQ